MLVKLVSSITLRSLAPLTGSSLLFPQKREAKVIYLGSHLSAAKYDKLILTGLSKGWLLKHEFRNVNRSWFMLVIAFS